MAVPFRISPLPFVKTGAHVLVPDVPLAQFVFKEAYTLGDKPALIDGPTGRVVT